MIWKILLAIVAVFLSICAVIWAVAMFGAAIGIWTDDDAVDYEDPEDIV